MSLTVRDPAQHDQLGRVAVMHALQVPRGEGDDPSYRLASAVLRGEDLAVESLRFVVERNRGHETSPGQVVAMVWDRVAVAYCEAAEARAQAHRAR